MGFLLDQQGESSCTLRSTKAGDDVSQFLACAQKALKNLWLEITLNIADNPRALGAVLPMVLKLQSVLALYDKKILLQGLAGSESSQFVKKLRNYGFEVELVPQRQTPPPTPKAGVAHGVIERPTVASVTMSEKTGALPSAVEVDHRFKSIQARLEQALRRKKYLLTEKQDYESRIKSLSSGQKGSPVDHIQIHKIAELEAVVSKLKAKRALLLKDSIRLQTDFDALTEITQKGLAEASAKFKREKDILESKLQELLRKQETLKGEFKKRSEARKQKLLKLAQPK